ncbi:MAG: ABC transporter permease [Lacunisphaera sp.]|nr:ABC transporter permease [Lacunisphaera sp.]
MTSLHVAFRSLCKAPGFALIAVLTLALGIGANTAIFSAVYSLLLRPLPFAGSDRLVSVRTMVKRDTWERRSSSLPDFRDYRAQATGSFDAFVAFDDGGSYNLTGGSEAIRVAAGLVSHGYFAVLGAQPALGRAFTAEEDSVPDKHFVAILSDGLWRSRFGADPQILGRTIQLNGRDHTVVGVMPAGFVNLSSATQIWLPIALTGNAWTRRNERWHDVLARLKPGATLEQARAELATLGAQLAREHPETNTNYGADLAPLRDEFVGDLRQPLLVLLGAVGFVLLITCANVANLLLVRLADRRREIAIRASLGASRGALARLFLSESAVLAALGGGLGLLLSVWLVELLVRLNPVGLPAHAQPALSWPVFAFAAAIAAGSALAVGLLPALFASRTDLNASLKDSARGSAGGAGTRVRSALVVAEIALSFALLTGSALLIRSFVNLIQQAPGYRTERSLALRVNLPANAYPNPEAVRQFARQLRERTAALPGVVSAALGSDTPLDDYYSATIFSVEDQPPVPLGRDPRAYWHIVSPEFFATAGIHFLQGGTFAAGLAPDSEPVAVVSESFARRFWPDSDALGKRFKRMRADSANPWMRIVGVVPDTKYRGLVASPTRDPDYFIPFDQRPIRALTLLVHTAGPSAASLPDLRAAVAALDSNLPVFDITTIEDRVGRASASQRFSAALMGGFAVVALLLAALGLYGLVSFAVGTRTREIGVRVALGASPTDVLALVFGGTGRLVLAGLAAGLLLTLGLARFIASLLYEVPAYDPATYAGVSLLLAAVVLLAAWSPTQRATRVDPLVALRAE